MTPREYLDQIVKPLADEFFAVQTLPHLFAAMTTTYHIVDYIRVSQGLPWEMDREVRAIVTDRDPAFFPIYCVCIAGKHAVVERIAKAKGLSPSHIDPPSPILWIFKGEPMIFKGKPIKLGSLGFRVSIDGTEYDLRRSLKSVLTTIDRDLPAIEADAAALVSRGVPSTP